MKYIGDSLPTQQKCQGTKINVSKETNKEDSPQRENSHNKILLTAYDASNI